MAEKTSIFDDEILELGESISENTNFLENTDSLKKDVDSLENTDSWMNGRYPLFDINKDLNEAYGIGGSPSLIINGQDVNSARDPASYLAVICEAFNDKPSECSEALSSVSYNPGFGWSESSSGSTDGQCG
jgi:predicted GNAT superfamily acetyltransferase